MPFVNPDATYMHSANRVQGFHEAICDLRDDLGKAAPDARAVNLNNMSMATNSARGTLRVLHWAATGGAGTLVDALGLGDPSHLQVVADDWLRSAKLFLLLECQFQTETLFRSILTGLGRAAKDHGFFKIAKSTLQIADISDAGTKMRTLNVPAMMRNSMHANGIHHGHLGSSSTETINGIEFKFENGKKVECGHWVHIVTALKASLDVTGEVLMSPKVSAITSIDDEYAKQKR